MGADGRFNLCLGHRSVEYPNRMSTASRLLVEYLLVEHVAQSHGQGKRNFHPKSDAIATCKL